MKKLLLTSAFSALLIGCMTPEQASRSTRAQYGDFEPDISVKIGDASNVVVSVSVKTTIGDGALASADSSGSKESQTLTPTFDISPKTDVRYNDAMAAASSTSKSVLDALSDLSKNAVLSMMADKSTGSIQVQKKDGSSAIVICDNGQCELCNPTSNNTTNNTTSNQ